MSTIEIPGPLDGTVSYLDRFGVYRAAYIEVQLGIGEYNGVKDHTWHVFLHVTSPPSEVDDYYYRGQDNLYDAITSAIFELDIRNKLAFTGNCILKGDWIEGIGLPTTDKRAWYKRMFDKRTIELMLSNLTDSEKQYIKQFF